VKENGKEGGLIIGRCCDAKRGGKDKGKDILIRAFVGKPMENSKEMREAFQNLSREGGICDIALGEERLSNKEGER